MAVYKVIIKETAQKQFLKLPVGYLEKVKKAILALQTQPRPNGCKKLKGSRNIYRIRVGIIRIVYEIIDKQLIVYIFDLGHRKDIYR